MPNTLAIAITIHVYTIDNQIKNAHTRNTSGNTAGTTNHRINTAMDKHKTRHDTDNTPSYGYRYYNYV